MIFPDFHSIVAQCHWRAVVARRKGQYDFANYWAEYAYQAARGTLPWWGPYGAPLFSEFAAGQHYHVIPL